MTPICRALILNRSLLRSSRLRIAPLLHCIHHFLCISLLNQLLLLPLKPHCFHPLFSLIIRRHIVHVITLSLQLTPPRCKIHTLLRCVERLRLSRLSRRCGLPRRMCRCIRDLTSHLMRLQRLQSILSRGYLRMARSHALFE